MTSRGSTPVHPCSPAQARSRRDQARAFLEVADAVISEDQREAHVAGALAVLGGIAAADAICGLRLGKWSRGQDHRSAVALLRMVTLENTAVPTNLERLALR